MKGSLGENRRQGEQGAPEAAMTRHQMRLKILRAGYSIPHSMEWMFWPMGYRPPLTFTGVTGGTVAVTEQGAMPPGFKHEPLARRYKITNIGDYTRVLLALGAIKEVKQ